MSHTHTHISVAVKKKDKKVYKYIQYTFFTTLLKPYDSFVGKKKILKMLKILASTIDTVALKQTVMSYII